MAESGSRSRLAEGLLVTAGLLAGLFFFASLDRLWPLADLDLVAPRAPLEERARSFLNERGFDLSGYHSSSALTVDTRALDYVESAFGRTQAQRWIAEGLPLVRYRARFKQAGRSTAYSTDIHPRHGVLGWARSVEEDEPGARLELDEARALAADALREGLGLSPDEFEERSAASTEQLDRRDHIFVLERIIGSTAQLRERVRITVAGDRVVGARRTVWIPPEAQRAARAAEAPGRALETLGVVLGVAGALAALFVFLIRLQRGAVRLRQAMFWPAVVFAGLMTTYALETPTLFRYWEPLWPRWVSNFQYLSLRGLEGLLIVFLLLLFVAAGDSLDRESGAGRGASLGRLARGRLDRAVAAASGRGFVVGLLCGGAMALTVVLLESWFGARTSIQPRGFFFYTLNTASPPLTSLCFFLAVALAEELGYRFFAGTWIFSITRLKWLAILIPAVIYGLTHTRLDFLPPAEPWWARPLVLTLVGAVWGWAFFRYDALTVVLSHFTADLFIFNWPRLASDRPEVVTIAALTVAVPLLPAAFWLIRRRK